MSISEPFIRRPIATSLLMLGMLVFGIVAYSLLPVAALPNVDFPTITVTANYPGASPATMASAIATPLEQQFTAIPSLDQMTSLSGTGTTTDHPAIRPVAQHRRRGAGRADRDQRRERTAAEGPAEPADLQEGQPGRLPRADLRGLFRRAAGLQAGRLRLHHPGAAAFDACRASRRSSCSGRSNTRARVEINPGALAAHGIGLEDVRNALVAATVNGPKGAIEGAHQATALDTNDQLFNAVAVRQRHHRLPQRRAGAGEGCRRGRQLGRRTSMSAPGSTTGRPRASRSSAHSGANTIELVNRIKALMPHLEASIPPSRACQPDVRPLADHPRPRCTTCRSRMTITIGLVVLVIFIFLRTVWATIIPSMAVPLSLLATPAVMYAAGYNLDNISLMALTISVGFVVDDAIVMIENIVRYIEQGERPFAGGAARGRADRLHHHLDHLLADRGLHPAVLHGRHHRPAVPRIRGHGVRRGGRPRRSSR